MKILQHFGAEMLRDVFLQQQNIACKYTAVLLVPTWAECVQLFTLFPLEDLQDMPQVMWCFVLVDVDKREKY